MRTIKLSNYQETLVVEIETDAISDNQDNMTIHDINTIKGDFEKFVEKGFYLRVPDVISKNRALKLAPVLNVTATIINPENGHETVMVEAVNDFEFDTNLLDLGTVAVAYEQEIQVSGGIAPYSFDVSGLPAGLELSEDGILAGTPEEDGVFTVIISCFDYFGQLVEEEFTLTISGE